METDRHYYPPELAQALQSRWPAAAPPLPPPVALVDFISTAYQASLLSEEGRPVLAQLAFVLTAWPPGQVSAVPDGPHLLPFAPARPYTEQEVRRLSPTVQRRNNQLAVGLAEGGERLELRGLLAARGAWDAAGPSVPPVGLAGALGLHLRGPGHLVFYCGSERVLTLHQGRIDGHGFVQFPAAWGWGRGRFEEARRSALDELARALPAAGPVDPELVRFLSQHVQRQAIARVRAGGHGGLLVLVSEAHLADQAPSNRALRLKYPVQPRPPGQAVFYNLLLGVAQRLAALGCELSLTCYRQFADDPHLQQLNAEADEFAALLADLMAVDGALVLTKRLQVVGFGAEIYVAPAAALQVCRALDLEANAVQAVAADSGGTRHRAAYRLCLADPDCLAVVVSQDGGVEFVRQQEGRVVFWDQL